MEVDRHFSHPHPLISFLVDDMEVDVTDNYHSCKICGLPILSAPSYTCTIAACDFFLHESCAHKFREKFIHPSHGRHTLCLREGNSHHFSYKCEDCNFQMHPLYAVDGVEIKSKHKSHPSHPLVAICKETLSLCDVCGERHDGFFFSCQQCNFWIHQDCTILPSALTLPSHPLPLLLIYSPFGSLSAFCIVCGITLSPTSNAIYYRPGTKKIVHVTCGLEKIQSKTRLELIQLPDDEFDTFPSVEIRTYSQGNQIDDIGDEDSKHAIEILHKHPLILVGDEEEDHNYNYKKLVCDICMRTIIIPYQFYRCTQEGCSFLAHKACVQLLSIIKFMIPDADGNELLKARPCSHVDKWFFCSIYFCCLCCLPGNAPCYYLSSPSSTDDCAPVTIDLPCVAAPYIIKHSSHCQHILFRTTRLWMALPISCCSRGSTHFDVYKCTMCNFYIHIRCALLPKKVSFHKFDQHPLHLITSSSTINSTGRDHDICEVCEEGIECKYWFYHCAECDYSFHINCIPSLGYLSKVKFGGKFSIPCHSHPLTLKRMLTYERNERCGFCDQIIPGLVDQVAFSCSQCDYLIHFSCARDSFFIFHNCIYVLYGEIGAVFDIGDSKPTILIDMY